MKLDGIRIQPQTFRQCIRHRCIAQRYMERVNGYRVCNLFVLLIQLTGLIKAMVGNGLLDSRGYRFKFLFKRISAHFNAVAQRNIGCLAKAQRFRVDACPECDRGFCGNIAEVDGQKLSALRCRDSCGRSCPVYLQGTIYIGQTIRQHIRKNQIAQRHPALVHRNRPLDLSACVIVYRFSFFENSAGDICNGRESHVRRLVTTQSHSSCYGVCYSLMLCDVPRKGTGVIEFGNICNRNGGLTHIADCEIQLSIVFRQSEQWRTCTNLHIACPIGHNGAGVSCPVRFFNGNLSAVLAIKFHLNAAVPNARDCLPVQ